MRVARHQARQPPGAEPGAAGRAVRRSRPPRIGLSATQKPLDAVARFLVGGARRTATGGRVRHHGHRPYPRSATWRWNSRPCRWKRSMPNDVWELRVRPAWRILAAQHRTTLVFVNTRRMAERAARHLAERLGEEAVAAHHGSLRQRASPAMPSSGSSAANCRYWWRRLRWNWASISATWTWCARWVRRARSRALLQRVGRAGHHVGGMPKGRLFPTSRDDLIECAALLDCVRRGELDLLRDPARAAGRAGAADRRRGVACREWSGGRAVSTWCGAPQPYADLPARALRRLAAHAGRGATRAATARAPPTSTATRSRGTRARQARQPAVRR